ncbi:MAG: hypothetical protein F7C81_02965 [Desulfurococcales archaeon]|nr:hypothetical protein [Desulfurococcales archaeon]
MGRTKARKGLSPLVATVVLISATVIGGMLIYNYFQDSVGRLQGMGENLVVTARSMYITDTTRLVYIEATNNYDKPVLLTGVKGFFTNGTTTNITVQGQLPLTMKPGDKISINAIVDNPDVIAVSLVYQVDGREATTEPVKIG